MLNILLVCERLKEEKAHVFFLYASSIYITKTDRHDTVTDTGKLPASGFHLFFAAA